MKTKDELKQIPYPCVVVIYGPERIYRTKYRSEHGGVFHSGIFESAENVWETLISLKYMGYLSEMTIRAYFLTEPDNEDSLTEREL